MLSLIRHAHHAKQTRPARKNLRGLRTSLYVAEKVGALLGGSETLLDGLSAETECSGVSDRFFERSARIARPAAEVFAWHERPGAFERLAPPWQRVEVLAHRGGIRDGARVSLRTYLGPISQRWEIEHRDYVAGSQFRDVLLSGPFVVWDHLHRFEADGEDACVLTDSIRYRLPGGAVGALGVDWVERMLTQTFAYRHRITRADLEETAQGKGRWPRRVLISGASGLIGRALTARLTTAGSEVVSLVRRPVAGPGEVAWDPSRRELSLHEEARFDAVVHLAGANIAAGRWSEARKRVIRQSREDGTATVVRALVDLPREQRPAALVSASAVGWYGETGERLAREGDAAGSGFLADVCREWEAALAPARDEGVRTVAVRTGVVLTPRGGALGKMRPAFRAGLGGRLGDGRQWMSWIALEDLVEVYGWALRDAKTAGPINAVAPSPVRNADFTAILGTVLRRPAVLPMPAGLLRLALGEMADEALLGSARADAGKLTEAGFVFRQPELENALRQMLGKGVIA